MYRLRQPLVENGIVTARTACRGNRCTAAGDAMVADNDRGRYFIATTTKMTMTTLRRRPLVARATKGRHGSDSEFEGPHEDFGRCMANTQHVWGAA